MPSFYKGKIILTGEHSVVAGHSAILANIDLGISAHATTGLLNDQQQQDHYLQHILQIFVKFADVNKLDVIKAQDVNKVQLEFDSKLPTKSGLGSSAAFAAATLTELANFYSYPLDEAQLHELVWQAENFIHGQSSGADPAIVVYGGLIAFKKGQVQRLSSTALIDKQFFLIDSGEASESTGEMVALVASQSVNQMILQEIGQLSQKMLINLKRGAFLPQLLNDNQLLLEQIGVVGAKARAIIADLQQTGACCKITGAGGVKTGSGYILAFHEDVSYFTKQLQTKGLSFFTTHLGKTSL